MSEIMSCPLCNGKAAVGANEYYDGANTFYIYCPKCGVQQMETKVCADEAITVWNRRTQESELPTSDAPTNADIIRRMTDEELAELLATVKCRGAAAEACDMFWEDDSYSIDWLKAETEGEEDGQGSIKP